VLILQKLLVFVLAQLEGYIHEMYIFCGLKHDGCHIYDLCFQDVHGCT